MRAWKAPAEATIRGFAVAGIVGGGLSTLLTPLVTLASTASFQAGRGGAPPPRPNVLEPLLTFASPREVYQAYGRLWVPILLLFLLGAAALYMRIDRRLVGRTRNAYAVLLTGLLMTVPGNFNDYWLGHDILGRVAWGLSFLVFTLVGTMAYTVGSIWFGLSAMRQRILPPWVAAAFVAAPVGWLLIPVVPNAPAAPFLVIGLAWIVSGVHVLRLPAAPGSDGTVDRREDGAEPEVRAGREDA